MTVKLIRFRTFDRAVSWEGERPKSGSWQLEEVSSFKDRSVYSSESVSWNDHQAFSRSWERFREEQ